MGSVSNSDSTGSDDDDNMDNDDAFQSGSESGGSGSGDTVSVDVDSESGDGVEDDDSNADGVVIDDDDDSNSSDDDSSNASSDSTEAASGFSHGGLRQSGHTSNIAGAVLGVCGVLAFLAIASGAWCYCKTKERAFVSLNVIDLEEHDHDNVDEHTVMMTVVNEGNAITACSEDEDIL